MRQAEAISLAFITACRPAASPACRAHPARRPRIPRQRGGRMLDRPSNRSTAPSSGPAPACSASSRRPLAANRLPQAAHPPRMRSWTKFVRAWESADLGAIVALLTDDVFDVDAADALRVRRPGRRGPLLRPPFGAAEGSPSCRPANGQPALRADLRAPTGIRHGTGLYVLTLTGDRICALARFDNSVLPWFGLPRSLPSR